MGPGDVMLLLIVSQMIALSETVAVASSCWLLGTISLTIGPFFLFSYYIF